MGRRCQVGAEPPHPGGALQSFPERLDERRPGRIRVEADHRQPEVGHADADRGPYCREGVATLVGGRSHRMLHLLQPDRRPGQLAQHPVVDPLEDSVTLLILFHQRQGNGRLGGEHRHELVLLAVQGQAPPLRPQPIPSQPLPPHIKRQHQGGALPPQFLLHRFRIRRRRGHEPGAGQAQPTRRRLGQ